MALPLRHSRPPFVIPAKAGIQSTDDGERDRMRIITACFKMKCLGVLLVERRAFLCAVRSEPSVADEHRYSGFPLTICGNDGEGEKVN